MSSIEFDIEKYYNELQANSFMSTDIKADVVPVTVAKQLMAKAIFEYGSKAVDELYSKTIQAIESINIDFETDND